MSHEVNQRPIAESVAEARLLQCVRRVRHRLHAASDDHLVISGSDHLIGHLDRADGRRADFVDRVGADLDRQSRADRRLPSGRLARAALQHLPHDHVLRFLRLEAAALERGADDDRAELGRFVVGQAAAELAERRSNCGDDHRARHVASVATRFDPTVRGAYSEER